MPDTKGADCWEVSWSVSGLNNNQNERLAAGDFWGPIHEMYIKWAPADTDNDFYILAGKRKQLITTEFSQGPHQILTIERSHRISGDTWMIGIRTVW